MIFHFVDEVAKINERWGGSKDLTGELYVIVMCVVNSSPDTNQLASFL